MLVRSCTYPPGRQRDGIRRVASSRFFGGHPPRISVSIKTYGAGTATRLPGTICGWKEKTSRLRASTVTLSQFTSLLPLAWLSPKVSTRVKFSRRCPGSRGMACRCGSSASRRGRTPPVCGRQSPRCAARPGSHGSRRAGRRFPPASWDRAAARRVRSERSKPGSACVISITAAEPRALASANVSCSHAMLAALRAANSLGSGAVSHRLLHEPCTLSVAKVTPPMSSGGFPRTASGRSRPGTAAWTALPCRSRCWPMENGVLKKTWRSWSSRSSELKPPLEAGHSRSNRCRPA